MALAQGQLIRNSGEYMFLLVFYTLLFPWLCAGILGVLTQIFGSTPTGKLAVLVVWSIFLAMVYLNVRLVAVRCLPYTAVPVLVLPLQLVGDLVSGFSVVQIRPFSTHVIFCMHLSSQNLVSRLPCASDSCNS